MATPPSGGPGGSAGGDGGPGDGAGGSGGGTGGGSGGGLCALAGGAQYFGDEDGVQFSSWTFIHLNATPESPPLYGSRGGPWFEEQSNPPLARFPSNAIYDIYTDKDSRYLFMDLWHFNYVDRVIFNHDEMNNIRNNCADGRDGAPPPPPDHGDGAGGGFNNNGSSVGGDTFSAGGYAPGILTEGVLTKAHFEHRDDVDRFTLTLAEGGTLGLTVGPENFGNRLATSFNVTLRHSDGSEIQSMTASPHGTVAIAGTVPGNYLVDVQNLTSRKGGYNIIAQLWGDIPPDTFGGEAEPTSWELTT